jgi:hypothetical protein
MSHQFQVFAPIKSSQNGAVRAAAPHAMVENGQPDKK